MMGMGVSGLGQAAQAALAGQWEAPMTKKQAQIQEDIMWCATQFQNQPDKIARALQDKDTRKEFEKLVGDLFSLIAVIVTND